MTGSSDRGSDEISRRQFVKTTAAGAALLVMRCTTGATGAQVATAAAAAGTPATSGPFTLSPLPWQADALEPYLSAGTMGFHHGKHHQGYVDKLNAAIEGTDLAGLSLEDIVLQSAGKPDMQGVFNNAAQTFNHTFYFEGMKPGGGGVVPAELADRMKSAFGSVEGFKEKLASAALSQFGSGWAWLVLDGGDLQVVATSNADTPLAHGQRPLATIDVWEHAYYLDYQNRRADYIAAWLEHLVNWDLALASLG